MKTDILKCMATPIQEPLDSKSCWTAQTVHMGSDILERMERAVTRVRQRLLRATAALNQNVQDMIGVGLIDPSWLTKLPPVLAARLKHIMDTPDA